MRGPAVVRGTDIVGRDGIGVFDLVDHAGLGGGLARVRCADAHFVAAFAVGVRTDDLARVGRRRAADDAGLRIDGQPVGCLADEGIAQVGIVHVRETPGSVDLGQRRPVQTTLQRVQRPTDDDRRVVLRLDGDERCGRVGERRTIADLHLHGAGSRRRVIRIGREAHGLERTGVGGDTGLAREVDLRTVVRDRADDPRGQATVDVEPVPRLGVGIHHARALQHLVVDIIQIARPDGYDGDARPALAPRRGVVRAELGDVAKLQIERGRVVLRRHLQTQARGYPVGRTLEQLHVDDALLGTRILAVVDEGDRLNDPREILVILAGSLARRQDRDPDLSILERTDVRRDPDDVVRHLDSQLIAFLWGDQRDDDLANGFTRRRDHPRIAVRDGDREPVRLAKRGLKDRTGGVRTVRIKIDVGRRSLAIDDEFGPGLRRRVAFRVYDAKLEGERSLARGEVEVGVGERAQHLGQIRTIQHGGGIVRVDDGDDTGFRIVRHVEETAADRDVFVALGPVVVEEHRAETHRVHVVDVIATHDDLQPDDVVLRIEDVGVVPDDQRAGLAGRIVDRHAGTFARRAVEIDDRRATGNDAAVDVDVQCRRRGLADGPIEQDPRLQRQPAGRFAAGRQRIEVAHVRGL